MTIFSSVNCSQSVESLTMTAKYTCHKCTSAAFTCSILVTVTYVVALQYREGGSPNGSEAVFHF